MCRVVDVSEQSLGLEVVGDALNCLSRDSQPLSDAGHGPFPFAIEAVHCDVASMTTRYRTRHGAVVDQQAPLVDGLHRVADFDRDAVIAAIRRDQRGESTYSEFMVDIWHAGVVAYDIDLVARTCTYLGLDPDIDVYVEDYPAVTLDD